MATAIVTHSEIERVVPQTFSDANRITVKTGEDYEFACAFLQLVATQKKKVNDAYDTIVKKAHEAHKEAVATKKRYMDPLLQAETIVKGKVSFFLVAEERKRLAEQQRLTDIARKQEEERALAEAVELEASGEKELAEMVLQNATEAPAPVVVVESEVPKQTGVSSRTNWKWRFKVSETASLRELVKAAAADDRLLCYLTHKETAIGSAARTQESLTQIPGIEVYPDKSVSVRA